MLDDCFDEVFGRPFPEPLWATEDETRTEIADRYRRVWAHTDAMAREPDVAAREERRAEIERAGKSAGS